VYGRIEQRLQKLPVSLAISDDEFLSQRLDILRQQHAEALRALQARALAAPRRKLFHQIRLLIKTIRYQEEWALDGPLGKPTLLTRLKRVQSVLGAYEDRAQFRKWSRSLKLGVRPRIRKDWRLARRRAWTVASQLDAIIDQVSSRRLWLVPRQARFHLQASQDATVRQD
jgi:CHAD domain-containing protein